MKKRTALLSVYNKEGIIDFARSLLSLGFTLLSSGGTAKVIAEAGLEVTDIASIVGEPILGHRVVTLSREIHAGLLARDAPEDRAELEKIGVPFIDLVCVDLYPLEQEVKNPNATLVSVIEKTDIGGPTMIRSAAKGGRIVIMDFSDREKVISLLKKNQMTTDVINDFAAKAEFLIAQYCMYSACFRSNQGYFAVFSDHTHDPAAVVTTEVYKK